MIQLFKGIKGELLYFNSLIWQKCISTLIIYQAG